MPKLLQDIAPKALTSWAGWLELWDEAEYFEQHLGLLHHIYGGAGIPVSQYEDDPLRVKRTLFLLDLIDERKFNAADLEVSSAVRRFRGLLRTKAFKVMAAAQWAPWVKSGNDLEADFMTPEVVRRLISFFAMYPPTHHPYNLVKVETLKHDGPGTVWWSVAIRLAILSLDSNAAFAGKVDLAKRRGALIVGRRDLMPVLVQGRQTDYLITYRQYFDPEDIDHLVWLAKGGSANTDVAEVARNDSDTPQRELARTLMVMIPPL